MGYTTTSESRKQLQMRTASSKWKHNNDPDIRMRIGQGPRQKNATPDLTWLRWNFNWDWWVDEDPISSDHLTIRIEIGVKNDEKKTMTIVQWDEFRTALSQYDDNINFSEQIQHRLSVAMQVIQVWLGAPTPYGNLLNLYGERLKALEKYSNNKTNFSFPSQLNKISGKINKYTKDYADTTAERTASLSSKRRQWEKYGSHLRAWPGRIRRDTPAKISHSRPR